MWLNRYLKDDWIHTGWDWICVSWMNIYIYIYQIKLNAYKHEIDYIYICKLTEYM